MFSKKIGFCFLIAIATATTTHIDDDSCTINTYSEVEDVVKKCTNIVVSNLQVPGGKSLSLSLKTGSQLVFEGRTFFDFHEWKGPLVRIQGSNLTVRGAPGSVLDGQGELYWDSLGGNGGVIKPKFITLNIQHSIIADINLKNCPVHCVALKAHDTLITGWNIDVSEGDKNNFTGHNTDGFDVSGTYITIRNSIVKNQDDCVVINRGSDILVSNMSCYGGHGLSLSLGFSNDFDSNSAHNIMFENSLVHRSPNGIHIKTHADSGKGVLENVIYRNIKLEQITNFGINIQQDYANGESTGIPGTNIPINNLIIENISGYMESYNNSPTLAAFILCGENSCSNWFFTDINITGAKNQSSCNFQPTFWNC